MVHSTARGPIFQSEEIGFFSHVLPGFAVAVTGGGGAGRGVVDKGITLS